MNILFISVTSDTSHADRFRLKVIAIKNIELISVTDDTSHADRLRLKVIAL